EGVAVRQALSGDGVAAFDAVGPLDVALDVTFSHLHGGVFGDEDAAVGQDLSVHWSEQAGDLPAGFAVLAAFPDLSARPARGGIVLDDGCQPEIGVRVD